MTKALASSLGAKQAGDTREPDAAAQELEESTFQSCLFIVSSSLLSGSLLRFVLLFPLLVLLFLALFKLYQSINENYKSKWKALAFNLKKNARLREMYMKGEMTAEQLCGLSSQEVRRAEINDRRNNYIN